MDRRNLKWITWVFAVATVLIVALMLTRTLQRSVHITLPPPQRGAASSESSGTSTADALSVVKIAPDTVQSAIATLHRPESYRRTIELEQFWSTGGGSWTVTAYVRSGWSRADRTMPDGRVRHTVTNGITTYIWYNNEQHIFTAPAGAITADNDQNIPTYEDILALDPAEIVTADYETLSDANCIYVETAENEGGYSLRYWVSVDTGLLAAAERWKDGELVYSMSALTLDAEAPAEKDFTLPDGTVLS